jgi:hypothetical protein
MMWISKLNPVRIIRKVQNEWYERAEARQVFEIMELLRPSADFDTPPDAKQPVDIRDIKARVYYELGCELVRKEEFTHFTRRLFLCLIIYCLFIFLFVFRDPSALIYILIFIPLCGVCIGILCYWKWKKLHRRE